MSIRMNVGIIRVFVVMAPVIIMLAATPANAILALNWPLVKCARMLTSVGLITICADTAAVAIHPAALAANVLTASNCQPTAVRARIRMNVKIRTFVRHQAHATTSWAPQFVHVQWDSNLMPRELFVWTSMSVWRTRPSVWTGSAIIGTAGLTVAARMDGAWMLLAGNVWIRDRADALINTGMFLQYRYFIHSLF